METRIKGVLSPKASGSISITENGNYDVVDVANAIVNVVPEEVGGITPEGSITLTSNGVYDVTMYAEAVVDVENVIPEGYVKPSGTLNVTSNGTFDVTEKKNVSVNVPQPSGTIEITENGEHDVSDYAIANVNVATSGYSLKEAVRELVYSKRPKHCRYLFAYFTGDVNKYIDAETMNACQSLEGMFYYAVSTTKIPDIVFIGQSHVPSMFESYEGANETLPKITFKNQASFNKTFYYSKITEVPQWDLGQSLHTLENTFSQSNLIVVPDWNYNQVQSMPSTFSMCANLTSQNIDRLTNMINNISMDSTFSYCTSLTRLPRFNAPKLNRIRSMCQGCTNLETIEGIDLLNISSAYNCQVPFYNCKKLTNLNLYNIKWDIDIGRGDGTGSSDYCWLLTKESLIQIIGELIDTGSNKRLTIGSANLSKLTDVYVKITSTDADENGNVKLPIEVCESTDEGAMLITNYVTQKHWALA